jgi:hypothetical protein
MAQAEVVTARSHMLYIARRRQESVHRIDYSLREGEHITMPRGREKDRKTRKKHRKNVQRMKGLVKARRAAAKKVKR